MLASLLMPVMKGSWLKGSGTDVLQDVNAATLTVGSIVQFRGKVVSLDGYNTHGDDVVVSCLSRRPGNLAARQFVFHPTEVVVES